MTAAAPIDLRSDTVTRPGPDMRAAMAAADVGDDQFGEDPTIRQLQERVASLLGKEAALWLPTGTMANQVALRTLTRPGDDVIVPRECHVVWNETGAGAANSGVQFTELGSGGVFTAAQLREAFKPAGHILFPPTTLVLVENTHNRAGGVVFPQDEAERLCATARQLGAATFLDGARLWNAAVAQGRPPASLAAPFDLVSVAFSKGLGAPGGSALAGPREVIQRALRYRRMSGGAMRQVGFFAAAALYGLEHHTGRLEEDHANARRMAEQLAQSQHVVLDPTKVQTNIVVFSLTGPKAAPAVVEQARQRGVLLFALGEKTLRLVTHLDVTRAQCERAAAVLLELLESP